MTSVRRTSTRPVALIRPESEIGVPMYAQLQDLLETYHGPLARTRPSIALAWIPQGRSCGHGPLVLGHCRLVTARDRDLVGYDFVILLLREFWESPRVSHLQRLALLDHELSHATIEVNAEGFPKRDAHEQVIYRIRPHDLEEFEDTSTRYGCWKRDLEAYARSLFRAEARATQAWVGYSSLQDVLASIGVPVEKAIIGTWSEEQRRDILTWALLRQDCGDRVNIALAPSMPAALAAAVRPAPAAPTTTPEKPTPPPLIRIRDGHVPTAAKGPRA